VLAVGFAQGLYALDAADGSTDSPMSVMILSKTRKQGLIPRPLQVVNVMIQGLLQ